MTNATVIRIPSPFYRRHGIKKPVRHIELKPLLRAEQVAADIIQLFETQGMKQCADAPLTQTEHMVQSAMLAMEEMSELPVIIGALLHDIGYLLSYEEYTECLNDFGLINYE